MRAFVLMLLVGGLLTVAGCDTTDSDGDGSAINLRSGAVFSMSNARSGNTVVAYSRADDGTLTRVGSFDTGGTVRGSFEDTANGLVLGSAEGESSPNKLIDDADLLFATNAGSNSITVFSVEEDGLEQIEVQDSGGEKPVSITVNNGLVYVLHSGDLQILQADAAITEQGTSDIALSSDSDYLYNINSFNGTIQVFEIGDDGSLNSIQTVQAHDPSGMAAVLGIAAI